MQPAAVGEQPAPCVQLAGQLAVAPKLTIALHEHAFWQRTPP